MKIAAAQMRSGDSVEKNLKEAGGAVVQAKNNEAEIVVLPENFAFLGTSPKRQLDIKETRGQGLIQNFLSACARDNEIWVVGGSLPMASDSDDKVWAACPVYNREGVCVGIYDKIHLFDVYIENGDEQYMESAVFKSGSKPFVTEAPGGRLGVAICYDLRFPELFRAMSDLGARIMALPSAFTMTTGKAHWECLARARAIENQVFFVAAGQCGEHPGGRKTWGHSLIIDPWGTVIAQCETETGVIVADLDCQFQERLRSQFPCLEHRILGER